MDIFKTAKDPYLSLIGIQRFAPSKVSREQAHNRSMIFDKPDSEKEKYHRSEQNKNEKIEIASHQING